MQSSETRTVSEPRGELGTLASDRGSVGRRNVNSERGNNKQSLEYVMKTQFAGGLAGCAVRENEAPRSYTHAKTVVGPLDRVKILFQASNPQFAKYTGHWFGVVTAMRDINRQSGMRGLFRGHSATLLRVYPYAAIKFVAYEQMRSLLIQSPIQETPLRRLASGSFAGFTTVLFTYPLEVVRVRLAFETSKESRSSLSRICRQIYHEQPANTKPSPTQASTLPEAVVTAAAPRTGLVNFYRGFSPTLVGILPYAGMSFLTHDTACDWLRLPLVAPFTTVSSPASRSDAPPKLKAWAQLLAGGLAGLVSQTASYPLEVIRRRMQVGGAVGDGHRWGIIETAGRIYKEGGLRGFWVGLTIGYVKVVPMVAVSFFVYQRTKLILQI
ncbi:coenzyme A transporter [Lecanora helva]